MEPGEQSHNQAKGDVANGVSAASSRVVRRSASSQRRNERPKGDYSQKSAYAVYDHNSPGYEWLQPGWIVAEYLAKSSRTYKRYINERVCREIKQDILDYYARGARINNNNSDNKEGGGEK